MTCPCSGSTPTPRAPRAGSRLDSTRDGRRTVTGGPGQAGYTWNGPQGRKAPTAPQK